MAAVVLRTASTPERASSQEVQKPRETLQAGQRSVGMVWEFDVGDEVAHGFGAAEGEDCEGVCFVDCYVAGYVCGEGAGGEVALVIGI